jgi:hypothetical protein
MPDLLGPFETEREARHAADNWPNGGTANTTSNITMLVDVIAGNGVQLGAYDNTIIEWLAGYEPQMCAAIAGIIGRAARGGK